MLAWVMNLGFAASNASADVNEYLFYYHSRTKRTYDAIAKKKRKRKGRK